MYGFAPLTSNTSKELTVCNSTADFICSNGQLKEYLVSGSSKDDFVRRLKLAIGNNVTSAEGSATATAQLASQSSSNQTESIESGPTDGRAGQSREVLALLEERRNRLEAEQRAQKAKEKSEREARAAARESEAGSVKQMDPKKSADKTYAIIQKKRQQDARDERARILKRVEDDKIERREREALRREQARAIAAGEIADESSVAPVTNLKQAASTRSAECAVQVRLFDGSTIRSRFPSGNKLSTDVRKWVDDQRKDAEDGDLPYTFKQILTPLPNRTISISEEEESLQSLGLCPSVTMILVPVKEFTTAYEGGGTAGLVSRGVSAGVGFVSSGFGLVTGAFGTFLGTGVAGPAQSDHGNAVPQSRSTNSNVRSTADQRDAPDNQQLYNGNNVG